LHPPVAEFYGQMDLAIAYSWRLSMTLRAGIVGLGQVAWRFDEEFGRTTVWTHIGAYCAAGYDQIVGFDPDLDARTAFKARYPDALVVESMREFLNQSVDVVSICTPNDTHACTLETVLAATPKAIWCEKPLETDLARGREMVENCARHSVPLVVSHVRRWSPAWRRFKMRLDAGDVGTLRSLRVAMPNRLWSIGSHAVDLLLGWPVQSRTSDRSISRPCVSTANRRGLHCWHLRRARSDICR